MPTGYVPPANRPSPSAGTNITYAVNQDPAAIIINLSSNDISAGYYAYEFLKNIDTIMQMPLLQIPPPILQQHSRGVSRLMPSGETRFVC
jgi:hypothetical protein